MELTLEQLEKIRLNRLKKQADEMAKTSPNSVERSRLMMNNIVEERKRATARAEDIRDTIRDTQVGATLDYQRFRDATIPQGPPKPQVSPKKPEARSGLLQNIKTGAEYISGKGGAGIAAGTIRWVLANAPVFQPKHSFINSLSFYGPEFNVLRYVG